ncbi:hypothetical protein [Rhodococcus sp. USK13]|uniref:hypothetical protein n=1 Tax=Rhodococcus sp. USK13 TaxID=2806442 RepID=UPI001BCF8C35|nr:hypothetical protein [Rhodococcus sp. USK13]
MIPSPEPTLYGGLDDFGQRADRVSLAEDLNGNVVGAGGEVREYAPGTLREKFFGSGPRLPEWHPAAQYRSTRKVAVQ